MENINKEDFEINVDNINVEEIMNMIRKNIKEKGYKEHESINNFNFISENKGVNEIREDFESLHYLWNINLEREIKSKNKLFAFIKKIIRKLSRWYIKPIIEDQIIFNSIVVRTNSYLKSKLKETKEQLSNNTEEIKKILNEIKKESVMLAALAVESYPAKIENGILYIKFPNDQKFHSEQILLPEKKPKVEKIINTLCNTDVTIQTLLEDESSQNQEDKFLQKVINFFDGEILERK